MNRDLLIRHRHEVDEALGEKRMRLLVDLLGHDADLEQRPLFAAENEAHAEDHADGQEQRENQRAPVPQEFEVAGMPDGEEPLQANEVHARSSFPVSSRNRSSRLGGRMRRSVSGTRASISTRSVPSRSSVVISTRSLASIKRNGNCRAASGNS